MGAESKYSHIPIIDFSDPNLKQGSCDWALVKSQVRKAFEEYGCFQAITNKISPELRTEAFNSLEEFFNLPLETKELQVSEKKFQNYIRRENVGNTFESFGIRDPNEFDNVDDVTNIVWPQGNLRFSKSIVSFSNELWEFSKTIATMIVESLGLEKHLEEHLDSMNALFRGIKYAIPKTGEKRSALEAHKDINIFTLIYQFQVNGLEVKTKDEEWVGVDFKPNSFTVLAGDSLTAWTNDRLYTPFHRVLMSGNTERYTIAYFIIFKPGYVAQVPEELVDEEHPLQYKPFDFFEYATLKTNAQVRVRVASTIKDYYGIDA